MTWLVLSWWFPPDRAMGGTVTVGPEARRNTSPQSRIGNTRP
jgi:hypothetical protein